MAMATRVFQCIMATLVLVLLTQRYKAPVITPAQTAIFRPAGQYGLLPIFQPLLLVNYAGATLLKRPVPIRRYFARACGRMPVPPRSTRRITGLIQTIHRNPFKSPLKVSKI